MIQCFQRWGVCKLETKIPCRCLEQLKCKLKIQMIEKADRVIRNHWFKTETNAEKVKDAYTSCYMDFIFHSTTFSPKL